jgi:hypothetical protein
MSDMAISAEQLKKIAEATRRNCYEMGDGPAVLVWPDGWYKISTEGQEPENEIRTLDHTHPMAVLATPMDASEVKRQIEYAQLQAP